MTTSKKGAGLDINEIAERSMKGWKAVTKQKANFDSIDASKHSDTEMPSTEALKNKWFGPAEQVDSMPGVSIDTGATANVVLQSGPLEKVVGVSNGKVLWRQG